MDPEVLNGETNKHGPHLNQERFQSTNMLFQTSSEFLEDLKDGKDIECVDIQNESHRDNKNISDNKTLMNNDQKHPKIKYYVDYKTLGFN